MASNRDNQVLLIMGASRSAKLMPRYLDQLQLGQIPFHVEYTPEMSTPSDGTLAQCVRKWMDYAERFEQYERLVLTDAWDFLFLGSYDELVDRLSLFAPHVLFGAEINCYPEGFLSSRIKGDTPYRFLNGGCLTASPDELWRWCRTVERHPDYQPGMVGQQWLNRCLAAGAGDHPLARIDRYTYLFYCAYMEEQGYELTVKDGRFYNPLTKTSPLFLHLNGDIDPAPFLAMMDEEKARA